MERKESEDIDVAIVGGGPAGLQAALVLARTRKTIVVFDSPDPSRNAASHGVHRNRRWGIVPSIIHDWYPTRTKVVA